MARQHVHNRRAGRGNGGSYWISYSDIMAALVLVFVLFLVFNLYQYNKMMEEKTLELERQEAQIKLQQDELDKNNALIIIKQGELDKAQADLTTKEEELALVRSDLEAKQKELDTQTIILIGQQEELDNAKATLAAKETELNSLQLQLSQQREAFERETASVSSLVGIRTEIVAELTRALTASNLAATVDPTNGDIVLESAVFFESGKSEIRDDGKSLLNAFLPVYLGVLLQPKYRDYLGEIIVEGHTDSTGTYIKNLKLSQDRALNVVIYCFSIINSSQQQLMQEILTAKGRSSSDPIYNADGSENKDASRRVEFKFSLRDAEMIQEMNRILQGH